jgi:anaerobic magnesium-protoporphyrin IX monomethyl ester cyclase
MSKVILINPNYYEAIFAASKVRSAISRGTTTLGLAVLGASLLKDGHEVKIIDLNLSDSPDEFLTQEVKRFAPDMVGITSTTPLIKNVYSIAQLIKSICPRTLVVAGGPHPSALPREVLQESVIDCVVRGEGDLIINRLASEGPSGAIPNLYFKQGDSIHQSAVQDSFIENFDDLPLPAYELFDIPRYVQPRIATRRSPMGYLESSRGCFARCVFCNKNIHGFRVRMKSPVRVVDEMQRMLRLGFKEIHVIDDIFTADMDRSYKICEEILSRGLRFPWYPRGGIRVDRVNLKLLKIMKRAGCYRIPFGIESGSQRILDCIGKHITLAQAANAVALAKQAGLETECYFMLGLPTETEDDIKKSIAFAINLDPDYVKFAITIPLPGTPMYEEMRAQHQIKTYDWSKYTFSTSPKEIYDHDVLSWQTIDRYSELSYKAFYFRPWIVVKTIVRTLLNGSLWWHIMAFLKTRW